MLYAFRHAPVDATGLCYGRSDLSSSWSWAQAAEVVASLVEMTPQLVWTSPSSRCRGPAELLAERFQAELRVDERLYELSFGQWEGKAWSDVEHEPAFETWANDWYEGAPPEGESTKALQARVRAWWAQLESTRTHLWMAHAGPIRALRVLALGQSWQAQFDQPVPHLGRIDFPCPV